MAITEPDLLFGCVERFTEEYDAMVRNVAAQIAEQRACTGAECAACITDAQDIIALIVGPVE